jgi:beta-glucosidase
LRNQNLKNNIISKLAKPFAKTCAGQKPLPLAKTSLVKSYERNTSSLCWQAAVGILVTFLANGMVQAQEAPLPSVAKSSNGVEFASGQNPVATPIPELTLADVRNPTDIEKIIVQMTLEEKLHLIHGGAFGSRAIVRLKIPAIQMVDGPQGVRGPQATAFPGMIAMVNTWNPSLMESVAEAIGRETRMSGRNMILGPCVTLLRVPYAGRNHECFGEDPELNAQMAGAYVRGVLKSGTLTSTKHFILNNQEINRNKINMMIDERALHELELPPFEAAIAAGTSSIMTSYNRVNGTHAAESKYVVTDLLRTQLKYDGLIISDWSSTYNGLKAAQSGLDLEMPGNLLSPALGKAIKKDPKLITLLDAKVRSLLNAMVKAGLHNRSVDTFRPDELSPKAHVKIATQAAAEAIVLLKNENLLPLNFTNVRNVAVIGPNARGRRYHGGGSGEVSPKTFTSFYDGIVQSVPKGVEVKFAQGVNFDEQLEQVEAHELATDLTDGRKPGLRAEYFANLELAGDPAVTLVDPYVWIWNTMPPRPEVPHENYSVRWSGYIYVSEAGPRTYGFDTVEFGYRFYLDDKLVIDNWSKKRNKKDKYTANFAKPGWYPIKIEYKDKPGAFRFRLAQSPTKSSIVEAEALAKAADVAIVVVGTNSGIEDETRDRKTLQLPGQQNELVQKIIKSNPRTIVVSVSGGPILMRPWRDQAAAIVHAGFAGQESGLALAQILTGDATPSGRLAFSIPRSEKDIPANAYYPGNGKSMDYGKTSVFEGYRGYDHKNLTPEFPFGFGLSYGALKLQNITLQKGSEPYTAKVKFQLYNTGSLTGAETVQVYVSELKPSVPRPPKELKGFKKLFVSSGRRSSEEIELNPTAFRFWDAKRHGWHSNPGTYVVWIGTSSRDLVEAGRVEF